MLKLDVTFALREAFSGGPGASDAPTAADLDALVPRLRAARDRLLALERAGRVGFAALDRDDWDIARAVALARDLRTRADHLVVLGIGGSALGAIALRDALRPEADAAPGAPRIVVLDTVDPARVAPVLRRLIPRRTAVAVISKSGGTVETAALFRVFADWLRSGAPEDWKRRLVFVTDRRRGLLRPVAQHYGIPALPVPDDVGGRFSVLTAVGALPLAFLGIDVDALIDGAAALREAVLSDSLDDNPAFRFAAIHDLWWPRAVVSVFFPYCDRLGSLGAWFQQLWAESLGKPLPGGKEAYGWTPAPARGPTDQHSRLQLWQEGRADRLVTFVQVEDPGAEVQGRHLPMPEQGVVPELERVSLGALLEAERLGTAAALVRAGRPVLDLSLPRVDERSLGGLILVLEAATAYAGLLRGLDPFDQPGVEAGKQTTRLLLSRWDEAPEGGRDLRWALRLLADDEADSGT